jgi:phosphonate transport system substrate-binding protein
MKFKPRTVMNFALSLLCCLVWHSTSYAETVHKDVKDRDSTIVFGYTPILFYSVDPRDATEIMESWSRITEHKLGKNWKISTIAFKTFSGAERALKNKDVDIFVMIPEEYLNLQVSSLVAPILSAEYSDKFYNELLLLVRKDSGITGIEQLRGKKILIDNGQQGTIPIKWLDSLLAKQTSSKGQEFFGLISEFTKGNKVILPEFFHQVDACIASRTQFETMEELNPQIGVVTTNRR